MITVNEIKEVCELIDSINGIEFYRSSNRHYFIDGSNIELRHGFTGGIYWSNILKSNLKLGKIYRVNFSYRRGFTNGAMYTLDYIDLSTNTIKFKGYNYLFDLDELQLMPTNGR